MNIEIAESREETGRAAAALGAARIRTALAERGSAAIVVATGSSQFEMLNHLVAEPETPINELADLLERALNHLVDHSPARRAITYFESQTAELLGLGKGGIRAIGVLYGRIPSLRAELMRALPRENS